MTVTLTIPSSPDLKSSRASVVAWEDSQRNSEASQAHNEIAVERCRQIIGYYESEVHKAEHETARWLVEQLEEDEQEVAARCSYAYWFLSTLPQEQDNQVDSRKSARLAAAMREAIRHMSCADDTEEVLKLFRATIAHHTSHKTWLYRTCMAGDDNSSSASETIGDVLLSQQRRNRIHDEMVNYQANVVRGHDKEDRSIFFAFPRKQSGKADSEGEQAFADSILYSLERALASSEYRSMGRQDELFCVLNTKGGSCPPFKNLQAAVGVMQKFYPSRLKCCIVLNAPYIMTSIWKMLKPFLDPVTASKFVFPSSKPSKKDSSLISDLIDESQAMPVLMPGKGRLTSEVNVERFLYEVPFYELYDGCATISDENATECHKLQKLPSPTESNSTVSLSMTDSSSIDSGRSNTYSSRRRRSSLFDTVRFRRSSSKHHHQQQRKSKNKLVKVSVRSLAIGALAVENDDESGITIPALTHSSSLSSEVVVNTMKVHPRRKVVG